MKKILYTLLIISGINHVYAQDPNFSQFYNNPIYYNPGAVALNSGYSLKTNYRSLWTPIPGRFNTVAASFEAMLIPKLGFAVNAFSDVAGEASLRTSGGYLTYAYRPVETKNFMLQVGVNGGIVSKSIDWSKLRFSDQYHEIYGEIGASQFTPPSYNNVTYADFGTGLAMRFNHEAKKTGAYKRMMTTIGLSAMHLSQPKEGLLNGNNLPLKLVGSINTAILVGEIVIAPAFIYERQNKFQTATIGVSIVKKPLVFGVWLRNEGMVHRTGKFDSFIFNIGVNLPMKDKQTFKIMYSVDFTTSQLKSASFGSHEISLIYDWNDRYIFQKYRAKKSRSKRFQCPKDFMHL